MSRVLVLGDVHAPYHSKKALEAAARFNENYQSDIIVQVGDMLDQYAASRFPKDPEAYNASKEWELAEEAVAWIHNLFPKKTPFHWVLGNHDRRLILRATEANIPARLVRPLREVFPYSNWHIHADKPFKYEGVMYMHGDESAGTAAEKATRRRGLGVVQGHLHKNAGIRFDVTDEGLVFGMDVGCLWDSESIAARYARRDISKSFIGWGTVTNGLPQLWPYEMMRKQKQYPFLVTALPIK